jgi:hypothetical protein
MRLMTTMNVWPCALADQLAGSIPGRSIQNRAGSERVIGQLVCSLVLPFGL